MMRGRRASPARTAVLLMSAIVFAAVACMLIRAYALSQGPGSKGDAGNAVRTKPPTTTLQGISKPPDTLPTPTTKSPRATARVTEKPTHAGTVVTDGIDEVALRQAVNGTLFVIPVNDGYIDFGVNLLCSLRKLRMGLPWPASVDPDRKTVAESGGDDSATENLVKGIVFVAMDPVALRKLTAMGLPVVKDPHMPFISANSTGWGDKKFHNLVCTKLIPVTRFLKLGLNVILSDADIVFNMDPRPFIRRELDMTFSIGSCHKDLHDNFDFAKGDGIAKLNTGFYYARSTPGVINLMKRAFSNCRESDHGDQPAINSVLHSDLAAGPAVPNARYSYGFFDGCLFANGCIYFKHLCANTTIADPRIDIAAGRPLSGKIKSERLREGETPKPGWIRRDEPVMVHANFLVGKADKVKHLVKYKLWDAQCIASWMALAK